MFMLIKRLRVSGNYLQIHLAEIGRPDDKMDASR